jgi:hypothetical protein
LCNSEFPLPKDDFCQVWLKLAQRFWRWSWKCKNLTDRRQTDRQTTDNRRSEKVTFQLSWAKNKNDSSSLSSKAVNHHNLLRGEQGIIIYYILLDPVFRFLHKSVLNFVLSKHSFLSFKEIAFTAIQCFWMWALFSWIQQPILDF